MLNGRGLTNLIQAVDRFASVTRALREHDLGQPFRYGAHNEGVRFALLTAMQELRALAVRLAAERRRAAVPITRAHHALAQYNAAYRDLNAVLLTVTEDDYSAIPALGEWPIRYIYGHLVGVERNFFALVHYGARRQREAADLDARLPEGEANRLLGPYETFDALMETGTMEELAAYHAHNRGRALAEFAAISDAELEGTSIWWEDEPFTLEYRLHRMDSHLRQHTVQIEKALAALGRSPGEAQQLLRNLFAALAEVEGALIGAPALAEDDFAATELISKLAQDVTTAVSQANALVSAVTSGGREQVTALLASDANLANAISQDGVPVARMAIYYGQTAIAADLADSPAANLEIWDAAALGRLDVVREIHSGWGDFILNEYSGDGYTALQLACFFGREEVASYLVEAGADIHAASKNRMAVQPLHAATAGGHSAIVRLLVEAGADPNTVQQEGFRPLHSAAQNGDEGIVRLLLEHGADPALPDAQGRRPRHLAVEEGHAQVAELL